MMLYEKLAKELFETSSDLKNQNDLLDAGFALLAKTENKQIASYFFNVDEDFPADFVSEYNRLQKGQ